MTCASCGKQIPAGAHYCIHCGAEQTVPTPIAAVAAATSGVRDVRATRAANAAQAEPSDATFRQAANQASATGAPDETGSDAAPRAVPPSPAYAALPRHTGLAAAVLAACVVVGIAAFVAWHLQAERSDSIMDRMSGGSADLERPATPTASGGAPAVEDAAPATPAGAAAPAAEDAAPAGGAPDASSRPAEPADAGARSETPPPVEIRPLPARPAPARATRHPSAEKAAPPVTRPATMPAPQPATAPAATTPEAPRTQPAVDRWARMDEDLSHCTREDFIARVICGQRVRFRYCDGYWGKVPQCPASPPPERGQ